MSHSMIASSQNTKEELSHTQFALSQNKKENKMSHSMLSFHQTKENKMSHPMLALSSTIITDNDKKSKQIINNKEVSKVSNKSNSNDLSKYKRFENELSELHIDKDLLVANIGYLEGEEALKYYYENSTFSTNKKYAYNNYLLNYDYLRDGILTFTDNQVKPASPLMVLKRDKNKNIITTSGKKDLPARASLTVYDFIDLILKAKLWNNPIFDNCKNNSKLKLDEIKNPLNYPIEQRERINKQNEVYKADNKKKIRRSHHLDAGKTAKEYSGYERYNIAKHYRLLDNVDFDLVKYLQFRESNTTPNLHHKLPKHIAQDIVNKHGNKKQLRKDYYLIGDLIFNYGIDKVVITEGNKKALSLLDKGIPSVSVQSLYSFSKKRKENEKTRVLHPLLKRLSKDRDCFISLDYGDMAKENSRKNYLQQCSLFGKLLNEKARSVKVIQWDYTKGKGIDDYLARTGDDFWQLKQVDPTAFDQQAMMNKPELSISKFTSDITICSRYLDSSLLDSMVTKGVKLVCVKSTQNTGKTTFVGDFVERNDRRLLATLHRRSLVNNIADRLGLINHESNTFKNMKFSNPYGGDDWTVKDYNDNDCTIDSNELESFLDQKSKKGFATCVNSLTKVPASNLIDTMFIDEACQFSKTICDDSTLSGSRQKILPDFRQKAHSIMRNPDGLIILADADMNDDNVNFYCDLLEIDRSQIFCIENTYKAMEGKEAVFGFGKKGKLGIAHEIREKIKTSGQRSLILTASQKERSRLSTITIEAMAKKADRSVIRIDQKTIADPSHEAFRIFDSEEKLKQIQKYDVIAISPLAFTGIDLKPELVGIIDNVFHFSSGNIPYMDCLQSIERYRGHADVYLGISNECLYLENSIRTEKTDSFIQGASKHFKINHDNDLEEHDQMVLSKYKEVFKLADKTFKSNYKENYKTSLVKKGYSVTELDLKSIDTKIILEELDAIRDSKLVEKTEDVQSTLYVSEIELKTLETKQSLTKTEQEQLFKAHLLKRLELPLYEQIKDEIVLAELKDDFSYKVRNRAIMSLTPAQIAQLDFNMLNSKENDDNYFYDVERRLKTLKYSEFKSSGIERLLKDYLDKPVSFNVDDLDDYINFQNLREFWEIKGSTDGYQKQSKIHCIKRLCKAIGIKVEISQVLENGLTRYSLVDTQIARDCYAHVQKKLNEYYPISEADITLDSLGDNITFDSVAFCVGKNLQRLKDIELERLRSQDE